MRSRVRAIALAILIGPCGSPALPADSTPSPAALDAAIAALREDPNLGGQTKIRTLRWSASAQPKTAPTSVNWLTGFFEYAGQFGGLLLWVAGVGAAAMAAIWIVRQIKPRAARADPAPPISAVRQVGDLDIRPDSLPDDVSAAALELLRIGRVRDCLSLLYRASLSSAVHRFAVPIAAHHTEREVLGAVGRSLDEPRTRYFANLVAIWQRVVYAGEPMAPDAVRPLCTEFSSLFAPPP